ncbi:hypothetical protein [Gordonia malaquae]|uniref:hypothetical protein n=1 Tax=Gordonia malaquae TaxID=410332 RepID=UPI0030FE53F8
MRVVTGVKCGVVAVAVLVGTTACGVDGGAVREPDLSTKVVEVSAFPYGPATAVPQAGVPGAIADITFRPLRAVNDPEECTPAPVDGDSAHVVVGPGGPAGGTLTVMVARASDSRADFVDGICQTFRLGGTVGTTITTTVDTSTGVIVNRRDLVANGTAYAHVYELVRQEGSTRLYVQNRYPSATLSADEEAATRALFDAASTAAFGE